MRATDAFASRVFVVFPGYVLTDVLVGIVRGASHRHVRLAREAHPLRRVRVVDRPQAHVAEVQAVVSFKYQYM